MTRQGIEELVRQWVPVLHLTHWAIKVDWATAAEEGNFADITPSSSYDTAVLRFGAEFGEWSPHFAEGVVVHELLHLTARDLQATVDSSHELLPNSAQRLASAAFEHELEGFIDRVALVLVDVARR